MHCTARMTEMLTEFSKQLKSTFEKLTAKDKFLMEEIRVLEETKAIELPNFLPKNSFPHNFAEKGYPQLQSSARRVAYNLILKMRERSVDRMEEMIEMEKLADYTCNPEYLSTWNTLMASQPSFMTLITDLSKTPIFSY
ncbi:dynamin-related protein 4C [Thalictrum thalictroides]|uniref:Dynamin-related protein 4C n=1 Tax=Thalictrum thalictroides TaxID=46969 RepID=A0A7J6WEI7_THATH|nr:dynamin-related protein 4C [Thalictrum thalictroides]